MNVVVFGAIVAAVGVIIGPALTYFIANRKLSGKIVTSEAASLWAESAAIRRDLLERNEFLSSRISILEQRIELLEAENRALHAENGALVRTIKLHERTIDDQRKRITSLEKEKGLLENRVKELEDINGRE
jgi:chromosome segregation ATPase